MNGASKLTREDLPVIKKGSLDLSLLKNLIGGARKIYLIMASIATIVLLLLGTWYVLKITAGSDLSRVAVIISWLIFVVAIAMNIYFQWQTCLLQGAAKISETYKINLYGKLAQLLISVIGLSISPTIMSLSLAYLISMIVVRLATRVELRNIECLNLAKEIKTEHQSASEVIAILWHNSKKLGLIFIGAFLIQRFNIFVITYFLGLSISAQYSIAQQAIMVGTALAQVFFNINSPKFTIARVHHAPKEAKRILEKSLLVACLIYWTIAFLLIEFGPYILIKIHSKTVFPTTIVMTVMAIVFFLEMNHSLCATAITSVNRIPFIKSSLCSGIAIAFGSIFVGFLGLEVIWFVVIQGVVQLVYNNWKWPMYIFKELNTEIKKNGSHYGKAS